MDEVNFSPPQTINLTDFECQEGWILDTGGGGEGIDDFVKIAEKYGFKLIDQKVNYKIFYILLKK